MSPDDAERQNDGQRETDDAERQNDGQRETVDAERQNDGQRFDRLPATETERVVEGRATREEVLDWWAERFGVEPATFAGHSFWEKGAGKIWAFAEEPIEGGATVDDGVAARDADASRVGDRVEVEALGLKLLRTRQEHWKPTTNAVQRFGQAASRNAIELEPEEARRFAAGEDQAIERWDGDWGYLIATHELAGDRAVLGVGLYVHGELRSRIPKGRRRDLSD